MNLYYIQVDRKRSGMSIPDSYFITIAKDMGEAERVINDYFKKEPDAIIVEIQLMKNYDNCGENTHYIKNEKQTI